MARPELPIGVRQALDDLKRALASIYGPRLRGVLLYGSYARGDFREDSDVDVLVVLAGPVKPGAEITRINEVAAGICLRYDLLISILPVSSDVLETSPQVFFERVREEAVAA